MDLSRFGAELELFSAAADVPEKKLNTALGGCFVGDFC
jgi:hypothetical protein